MRKKLPFYYLLIGFLLGNFSLQAADFTISGKVSLIQEAVPLPFYEVNIADGEGKYVTTVKTGFSGKYSHTFDIPEGDNVQFEVAVIDQCTGNAIIVALEKDGNKATANFLVCSQDEEATDDDDNEEEDDKEEEEDNENNEDDDDDGYGGGFPDFLNCEAFGLDVPVCTKDEVGNVTEYANACEAIDSGIKFHHLTFCDGLPIGGGIGNGLGDGFNCDQLGIDLPINVCVTNAAGEEQTLPLCDAIGEGYGFNEIEFCEGGDFGGLGIDGLLDSLDCEGLGLNLPVCTTDADGNEITFDTPCDALEAGLDINQLSICDGFIGNELGDLDCDNLDFDIPFSVCITNAAGETEEMELCTALTAGLDFDQFTLCDGIEGILDSLDCEGLNIPVCSTDTDGNEITFNNPCEALASGLDFDQFHICGGGIDGFPGGLDEFDCESLGLEVDIPVCTVNELGEQVELMLCDALSQGIALEGLELCEGALDGIDCSGLGIDLPVCTTDADGNAITFDNPCDALAAGLGINELTFCDNLIDGILGDLDCETIGIDLPVPVCVTDENGVLKELSLCEALSQGYTPEDIQICDNILDGISSDDCEGLGLNVPVCGKDADGNKVEFANPCDALAAGLSLEDLEICDNLLEDAMASFFETTDTEEEEAIIEKAEIYPNPATTNLSLELKLAKNTQFEISIQSINGNAIYRQKYNAKNGVNVTHLDVSSLSAGIYVVRVISNNGIRAMKFIKQ